MKKLATALALSSALLLLPACVDYGYGYGGGSSYSGYYDNYYGSVYDGYWGPDSVFYYRTAPTGVFVRDDARHFRRDRATGYNHFRYQRHADMPQPPPHHRGNHDS
ncbi:MAG: hypothetical protein ABUS48_00855 [Pseudomonadota bacterium]